MLQHPVVQQLVSTLSNAQVLVNEKKTEYYRKGWRSGGGSALAVVFPKKLIEYWRVLEVCVENNCIIILQAANTGLTEGSTPSGDDYDREVVVINTLSMNQLILLGDGEQVIGFPGTTLHTLEKRLTACNRTPHSVIGSSSLGASIVGGVANNSGGSLVKRGPAYTELSVFAQVDEQGQLKLVNHLDIELGETAEEILTNLESGNFDKRYQASIKKASASDYQELIRDVNADTPSRYNADPSRLYEASGCAGKIAVFAVRLDTFAKPDTQRTFYIGSNSADSFEYIRRHILSEFEHLPEVAEYMHRDVFDVTKEYGKDTFLSVKYLGTDLLPRVFALKGRIDAMLNKVSFLPKQLSDKLMQFGSKLFPAHLPERITDFRDRYEHHLMLKVSDEGIAEAQAFLEDYFSSNGDRGAYFECTEKEAQSAYLNRFAAAGAAVRYQLMHADKTEETLALDIALRRNDQRWVEQLPPEIADKIDKRLYYGHFLCYVFHQDYVPKKGVNVHQLKSELLALLDGRGAKYPAEHNVGHLYQAEPQLRDFYQSLDPTNTFNPGLGGMEKTRRNCVCCA